MKEEIAAAVFFVARLVKRYGSLDNDNRERFAAALTSVLFENYKNHWHPNAPTKGQAYRSVNLLENRNGQFWSNLLLIFTSNHFQGVPCCLKNVNKLRLDN